MTLKDQLKFRLATKDDLVDIVRMLSDDTLGATRERFSDDLSENYTKAFEIISSDKNQELTIVELNGEKVATFHLTFIQYLTHQGGLRAQVEAVRTNSKFRGTGIGKLVFEYIIERAKERGCILLQLTTDKKRPEALRFYESIGFFATHEGMKLKINA
jgi:GNAT superfamily N-acetyltransferase